MSLRIAPLIAVWLATAIHAFGALDIGLPYWGFDGTVTAGTFNILSVEVRNNGASAFEGEIILDDGGTFGSRNAASYRHKVFIAPGTTRWVQFYPFIQNSAGDWRVVWEEKGREAKESVNTKELTIGLPAVVILADPESPTMRTARMSVFNEANFPPTVSATDALHGVVLNHQPRWDPTRRTAFMDWLKRGGIIHLLPGADGTMPVFNEELAPLNNAENVGKGRIIQHKLSLAEITPKALADAGFPAPELKTNTAAEQYYYDQDDGYFETLASVTKPDIAWWLIYFLTAVYIILIGPVFYILRKRDYRVLLGGFLATVAIFAWIFTVVGRRGYGEKQVYHSLAVARNVEGGKWDVRHFVHAFATSGDLYNLTYPGEFQLYAAPSRGGETVRASVVHGGKSHLEADIPLFSARPFVHRGVMPGPDFGLKVTAFEDDKKQVVKNLAISATNGKLPEGTIKIGFQYGQYFYKLSERNNNLRSESEAYPNVNQVLGDGSDRRNRYYGQMSAEQAVFNLRSAFAAQLAHEVSDDNTSRKINSSRAIPAGHIRLFLYAPGPAEFRMDTAKFQSGLEFVLYVLDLPIKG